MPNSTTHRTRVAILLGIGILTLLSYCIYLSVSQDTDAQKAPREKERIEKSGTISANSSPPGGGADVNKTIKMILKNRGAVLPQSSDDQDESISMREELRESVAPIAWEYTPIVLEQILSEQEKDNFWTDKIKEEAEQALERQNAKGTTVTEITCGESLCKSVQIHDNRDSFVFFRDSVGGPWDGGEVRGSSKQLENGNIQSTVFFSKNGDTSAFDEAIVRMAEMQQRIVEQ